MEAPEDNVDLISTLSSSGFPFQTAVAATIRELGLYQVHEELAWRQPDGPDKFIDIVAVGARVRLFIECKKTTQEKFIFLLPDHSKSEQTRLSLAN